MTRPRLLDLCSKAGGTSQGYFEAGFDVTGVDKEPQPHFPRHLTFIQSDIFALDLDFIRSFDVVAASPPCQGYSITRHRHKRDYPLLIPPTRELLIKSGRPYIIENVARAPLHDPILLCGSSFGLRVRRHRYFESSLPLTGKSCEHEWQDNNPKYFVRVSKARGYTRESGVVPVFGGSQLDFLLPWQTELQVMREAMGIQWMTRAELNQAIPPSYTKHIGEQVMGML